MTRASGTDRTRKANGASGIESDGAELGGPDLVGAEPGGTGLGSTGPANGTPFAQWRALSGRTILGAVRDGDLISAVSAPVLFFICFYVPLNRMADAVGGNYAQFVTAGIVLQTTLFTAMSASQRSAVDTLGGMGTRLRAMPVHRYAPLLARMSANVVRSAVSILAAIGMGYAFGFRFTGSILDSVGFVVLAVAFACALVFGADAFGALSNDEETASQSLLIPQLLLTMLSTGILPAEAFPGWIQPFVIHQPISAMADALRGLADGAVDSGSILKALCWIGGLVVVFGFVASSVDKRERA